MSNGRKIEGWEEVVVHQKSYIKESGNPGQYVIEDLNNEVLISEDRFLEMVCLHKDLYKDSETFWDMLRRDLFRVNK